LIHFKFKETRAFKSIFHLEKSKIMKKFILVMGFIGMFGVSFGSEPWKYEMLRGRCNNVADASFYACRPTELFIGCSVSAQTLCPEYGGDASL